jgi:hypothetical protein
MGQTSQVQTQEQGTRNVISSNGNWYASICGQQLRRACGSIREVPVIQYDNDECFSIMDFFERIRPERSDGSSESTPHQNYKALAYRPKQSNHTLCRQPSSAATDQGIFPGLKVKV